MINLSYNGQIIDQRETDGYVNATQMCQANGKKIADWIRLKETDAYVSYISSDTGIPISQLVISMKGNSSNFEQGTWIHPELAICLGRWISVEFAVWCDRHIKKYLEQSVKQQTPLKDIKWQKRLVLFLEKSVIPYDYFCIFTEATCGLISQFESLGYVLPEDATIDISIGQHWANFLRTQVDDIEKYRQKYPHYYPDSRGMKEANMYKLDLLPMFRRWMETDYKMRHLENYLKTKDKQAIYILADLMGIQFLPGMFEGNKKMIG